MKYAGQQIPEYTDYALTSQSIDGTVVVGYVVEYSGVVCDHGKLIDQPSIKALGYEQIKKEKRLPEIW